MKKNVASQKVGAQMTAAADGSDFSGTVTAYVTLDAGTLATGTVGSGTCTHEGHGYHTYAPSQAETNGDLVAVTFAGTGAITVTNQYETVGAPAGASLAADIAAIKAILPTALVSGRMDSSVGAMAANVMTAAAAATDYKTALVAAYYGALRATYNVVDTYGEVLTTDDFDDILSITARAELTEVPEEDASIADMIKWMFMMMRNKIEQTATEQKLYAAASSDIIGTATVSNDGTTATRNVFG